MKILMISDLHICSSSVEYLRQIFHRIDKVFEVVNREAECMEKLIIAMCGDVVNEGQDYYSAAEKIFDYMIKKAGGRKLEFIMVPGNHDLCNNSFCLFDEFCKKYQKDAGAFEKGNCYSKRVDNMNFILANSTFHKDHEYGKVDIDAIRKNTNPHLYNILLTHHSPISEDANDKAAIRDMRRVLDVINEQHIVYHLHGHTHGTYLKQIGACKSLGVGAMFQAAGEMTSQFHLISVNGKKIGAIKNYCYLIDRDRYLEAEVALMQPEPAGKLGFNMCADSDDIDSSYDKVSLPIESDFQPPEDYIARTVGPFDIVQRGGIGLLYNWEQVKTLAEVLCSKKRIVLIGEAGSGKSCELQNLAYELVKNHVGIPVFICLNNYVDETIQDLVKEEIGNDFTLSHVFIFDAYDEIGDQQLNVFAKRLNSFVKKHQNQRIVISTRNNFYRNALDETIGGTFDGFYEYALCPLTEKDINAYLDSKGIDQDLFMEEAGSKRLKEPLSNPFFLVQIVRLFEAEGCLPVLNQLMDKLIDSSLEKDDRQYLLTRNISEQKVDIIKTMQVLAFSMQCLKKAALESEEYQELLDMGSRSLMRYCGLWKKTDKDKWQFEHNNFREYLAACFLKQKTLEQIIQLVTYADDSSRIKESWVNVLSFLVLIYPDDSLLNWIIEVSPSIVVKFEAARLNEEYRTKAFCSIFEEYKQANMWISWNQNDVEELAGFGQTGESIDYLIREINESELFRVQSNAIYLLGGMTDFYERRDAVRTVLFDCCFHKNIRKNEIKAAIMALMSSSLYEEKDIERLLEYFSDETDSEIRYALYCYIAEHHLQETALDYVLKGLKIPFRNGDNYSAKIQLKEILKSLDSCNSIHRVFEYILAEKEYYEAVRLLDDAFDCLCVNSEKLYGQGDTILLEDMQKIFMKASCCSESHSMRAVRTYLKNIHQIFSTYEKILREASDENMVFLLEDIMDEECMDDFADKYEKGLLDSGECFISYVRRCRKGSYRYDEFLELIYQKDGVVLEERELLDYNSLRKIGVRRYFNALFDKNAFQKLVEELAQLCRGKDTTYEDLEAISYQRTEKRFDLDKVNWAISPNYFENRNIVNFVSQVNWERFSISNIYNEISSEKEIVVTSKQEKLIREYCLRTIGEINFDNEISYKKNGTSTYSSRLIWCVYFADYFSIEYEREFLLNMLRVPRYAFNHKNDENAIFVEYITRRLDEESIRERICADLKNRKVQGELAETYIRYCTEKAIDEAFELAESIIKDLEYMEWTRKSALKYVLVIKGTAFVIENYLTDADKTLLRIMAEELSDSRDPQLIECLIAENRESENGMAYLQLLIQMESEYGLRKYYDICKERNAIPDFSDDNNIASITEEIRNVSDVKHLDIVIKLSKLATEEGFRDHGGFGLYNSVSKAVRNIAGKNPQMVIQRLEEAKADLNCSSEFVSFCNYNLLEMKTQYYNRKDGAWNIDRVKAYIQGTV